MRVAAFQTISPCSLLTTVANVSIVGGRSLSWLTVQRLMRENGRQSAFWAMT